MKILAAPANFANQAMLRTRALRARGHDARHVLHAWGGLVRYGFDTDRVVVMDHQNWLPVQLSLLEELLEEGFDVFELRNRSLVYPPGGFGFFSGLDLPYIKGSGAKIVYGFTGYELRRRSVETRLNPYTPWNYGLELPYEEQRQLEYLDYLRQWVDRFIVVDPEMQAYLPEAEIIPRGIDLSQFEFVGVERTERPLVVHAPSDRLMKGSDHVIAAVEELQQEGLAFDFKLIEQMDHLEAAAWYRRADVFVDQLRIGWYGVAAVEAMALGKPVVAYVLESHYDNFEPQMPIVNANPDTIKQELAELIGDADRRIEIAEQSRRFAEAVHDIDKVTDKVEQLYRDVVAEPALDTPRPPVYLSKTADEPQEALLEALRYTNFRAKQLPELSQKARRTEELEKKYQEAEKKAQLYDQLSERQRTALARRAEGNEAPATTADVPRLRVCILSRKDLSRITRVVRQAQALIDDGHEVTVACLKRPVDELTATVPEVEWVELALDPWTRRRVQEKAKRERARAQRDARRSRARIRPSTLAGKLQSWALAKILALWSAIMVVPAAFLLRMRNEGFSEKLRGLRQLGRVQFLAELLRPFNQRANSLSFGEQVCVTLAGRSFEICQAHDNYALLAASQLAKQTRACLLYDAVEIAEHRNMTVSAPAENLLDRLEERRQRREEARIFKRAAGMVTIGDGLADWYAKTHRIDRPIVVRNCRYFWEYKRSTQIRKDCGLSTEDALVVWFGYAYPEQGIETIIEAARYTRPDIHFAILADTIPRWEDFYRQAQERAKEVKVHTRIHFLPAREPNELIRYVSGADLGIIPRPNAGPNVYYSMPNKFMEMVMARLPIAVSDLADMRFLIEKHRIGAIFDVTEPKKVARTVTQMLEPAAHSEMREAIEQAAHELCWENESEKYLSVVAAVGAAAGKGLAEPRIVTSAPVRQPPAEPREVVKLGATAGTPVVPGLLNIPRNELEALRAKERELERVSAELPRLRYQASRTEDLVAEVKALRYKSRRYEELRKEVLSLRYKVKKGQAEIEPRR